MKHTFSRLFTLIFVFLFATAGLAAQDDITARPRSEKLLNDLNVLIWSQAGTGRVTVRLRIHNGAAYDPKDREGTFALLGDILFPEESVREYFREDLGGDLTVEVNYDYVEVTGTARADAFLTVMETLAPALINTEIDKETTGKLKTRQFEALRQFETDGMYKAGALAAGRLYGDFPYGRRVEGTPESIGNLDFADLIYVRERFLTADNATLAIIGDVRSDYAYLAARRLMGAWNKAGTNIPATFRLPEAPETKRLIVYEEGETRAYASAAAEGFSRKDASYHAAQVLARILNSRVSQLAASGEGASAKIYHKGFLLRGVLTIVSEDSAPAAAVPGNELAIPAKRTLETLLSEKIGNGEFEKEKAAYFGEFTRQGPDRLRMDIDTYGLRGAREELAAVRDLSLADVQAAADKLSRRNAVEVVLVRRPPVAPSEPADPKDPK